jgi:DNA-binding response OmpR family regulator/signal transduction histidine kinase
MVVPLETIFNTVEANAKNVRILRSMRTDAGQCFVAPIDLNYLRGKLFPQLIRSSFGETASADYDFAVASRGGAHAILYGAGTWADVRTPFFSVVPSNFTHSELPSKPKGAQPRSLVIVERMESTISGDAPVRVASLLGPGIWELRAARKGLPLAAAFEQNRRRDLLLSLGVEALLLAAIVFLVVAARRIQRVADQKMQFVAGVSHELRTPVSAITLLSRNQADGLVEGADRVRQYGELIHQQSRRLNEMVEQALQYAGIRSGLRQPVRCMVDLKCLIEESVDARRGEMQSAGFAVELALNGGLPEIHGDAQWLRTAVDNLLSNALKHAGAGPLDPCERGTRRGRQGSAHRRRRPRRRNRCLRTARNFRAVHSRARGHRRADFRIGAGVEPGAQRGRSAPWERHAGERTRPRQHVHAASARMKRRILFVEDETAFAVGMIDRLHSEGYEVDWAQTGTAGYEMALSRPADLLVLDVMLPGKNGFDICRDLRRAGINVPVLMLTARGEVVDRVVGLKLGADDYVQKNCEPVEIMARIEALLRRAAGGLRPDAAPAEFGAVRVDLRKHEATRSGKPLALSRAEFRLLEYLIERRGTVVSREELLENVWSLKGDTMSRTVDVHIASLRKKIEEDSRYPRFLLTVKGAGYKLVERAG